MKGKDLLKGLSYVDDSLINEAEKKKIKKSPIRFVLPIAASFAVIITTFLLWTNHQNKLPISTDNNIPPIVSGGSSHSGKEYTLQFNNVDSQITSNIYIKGNFWEELTYLQGKKLLPNIAEKYQINGTVNHSNIDGETSIFSVNTRFDANSKDVKITMAPNEVVKCYLIEEDPVLSEIEGVKIEAGHGDMMMSVSQFQS